MKIFEFSPSSMPDRPSSTDRLVDSIEVYSSDQNVNFLSISSQQYLISADFYWPWVLIIEALRQGGMDLKYMIIDSGSFIDFRYVSLDSDFSNVEKKLYRHSKSVWLNPSQPTATPLKGW
ncbi:MAG TPA: hypothetical protein VNE86_05115 [Nitrososphaerales archaeon]|nr:hypothetical protein [Nitrososphaerales archaeon]